MKKLGLLFIMASFAAIASTNAQDTLYVYQKTGVITSIALNKIDSLIFYKPDPSIVYDHEGNGYKTLKVGTQTWMTENLRASKYRNGDAIATTNPVRDINGETNPKYQWAYDGAESNSIVYGRLYTWYAITDTRGVCPTGWHVPTDIEWGTLVDYLGGEEVAGGSLKVTGTLYWEDPNTGATNNSGLKVLGAGYSFPSGGFSELGYTGYFWTATHEIEDFAWAMSIHYNNTDVARFNITKKSGYSVRCVKD